MMTRLSFLLLALSAAIRPSLAQESSEEGQTKGLQLESVAKGTVSENPAFAARLRLRQSRQCVDPGYLMCSDGSGCCPPSRFCCPTDCCPKGSRCCSGGGCAFPGGECCGGGWSCPAGQKCFPGVQSLCITKTTRSCPTATTVTSTVTKTSKRARTTTRTLTKTPEEEEDMPEFSCAPMTATNDAGDTLELGDDCALEFTPATTTANARVKGAMKGDANGAGPQPRAAPCPDQSTRTVTITTTKASSYAATVTTTRLVAETAPSDFSCPPMTVTNTLGDQLEMDEECALEFSPGTQTQTQNPYRPPEKTEPEPAPAPTRTQLGGAESSIRGSSSIFLPLAVLAVAAAW